MITTGLLEPLDLTAGDWARVVELLGTYTDLALDLIDASIVAIAERLGQTTIATFDYRDVRVVRPAELRRFRACPLTGRRVWPAGP
jgi:hypothetical protein